jgi:hypothetical protein
MRKTMDTNDFITKKTYQILIEETYDDTIIKWFGKLTLLTQENGEIYLDLSFIDQQALRDAHDPPWNENSSLFSIECTENANIQETGD